MQDSSYHKLTAYSLVAIVLFLFFPKTLNGSLWEKQGKSRETTKVVLCAGSLRECRDEPDRVLAFQRLTCNL